ncbi:KEOPS complex subunit Pcc1 [Halomarina litorea]|uniref:KEOPS complex subunit Pcc1 n=1 Tax=Halomarina litorea TaxID=2961595 RepID=UPI0020C52FF0|nr:KEOPS complex subunit Pcc1 [Halomarina sp. BCD28]
MTSGPESTPDAGTDPTPPAAGERRATVRTSFADPETARAVADALAPDNTAEMRVAVDGDTVTAAITRETTGGLRSTADDYVTNLQVAQQLTDTDTNHE